MRSSFTIMLLGLLCISISSQAQWISFDKESTSLQNPVVKIISSNSNKTILEINISGVMIEEISTKTSIFQQVGFMSDKFTTEEGKPEVPYISKTLAIPNDASISYEIIEASGIEIIKNILLPPARKSWVEGSLEPEYLISENIYKSAISFPEEKVGIGEPVIFRDFRISRISIFPAQYNSQTKELRVIKKLKIQINYGNQPTVNIKTTPLRKISPSFASLYKATIFNYQNVLDEKYGGREDGDEVLLLITPDEFYENLGEYIQWKKQSGYNVIVTKFSDIGANASNPITIRDYIADVYENSENPPTYVVFVGDSQDFPYKIAVYPDYSFPDEDYFVKVDGEDFIPDMFVGRISVQTRNTLDVILNKFIKYEKEPYLDEPAWFKKAICCSNNAYESQVTTKEYTADLMLNEGEFTLVNEYMSDDHWESDCTYNNTDVLEAINEGRSFLNYRGEGWFSGWWANCTPLQLEDLDYLENGMKLPFVTSIGCGVSMFNGTNGNSFGERWLKMGTIENPRGAINFVGPTSNTHTTYNNYLDKGIYIGIFREKSATTPGQALLRGKMNVYDQFGVADTDTEYQFRVYCDLGDPSTRIWTTTPTQLIVSHPASISLNSSSCMVHVNNSDINFHSVNVNLSGKDFSTNQKTNAAGNATFEFTPTQVDTLQITVTGTNIKPYFNSIKIIDDNSITDVENEMDEIKNMPNPFTTTTEISYFIKKPSNVVLNIYNIQGKLIRSLENDYKTGGKYTNLWDGKDNAGVAISSGVYFLSLQTNSDVKTLRMIKLD